MNKQTISYFYIPNIGDISVRTMFSFLGEYVCLNKVFLDVYIELSLVLDSEVSEVKHSLDEATEKQRGNHNAGPCLSHTKDSGLYGVK